MQPSDLRRRRFINRAVCGLLAIAPLLAAAQSRPDPLTGISKTTTLVRYSETGAAPYSFSESRLKTLVELKLRTAGLRVLTLEEDERDPDINPYLYARVSTLETKNQAGRQIGFAYRIDLSARVFGDVPINRSRAPMELWTDSTMGVTSVESASTEIERSLNELIDSFLNAWLRANPRR